MLDVRMGPFFLLLFVTAFCISNLVGCKRDLGECNLGRQAPEEATIQGPAAFDIVYRETDGLPMYEGQALVQSTCGDGSFCHAPAAVGGDRIGVPAGLNFDVHLACTDVTDDPSCAQPIESCEGGQTDTLYCERLRGLQNNRNQVNKWAEGMIQEIRSGTMPPGEAGQRVRNNTPWIRTPDPDRPERSAELPSIDSSEGQEIVRNWLACEAPIVARTEIPPTVADELQPCESVDDEICVYSGPGVLPDPNWNDIYFGIMFTGCVICHGPANDNTDQNPNNPLGGNIPGGASPAGLAALDLTGANTADTTNWPADSWLAVVDALAADPGDCAGQGTLVIPLDPDGSIMIQKMRNVQTCGGQMPLVGELLSEARIQVVEEWINQGALNN
jgi:hypothetical protein